MIMVVVPPQIADLVPVMHFKLRWWQRSRGTDCITCLISVCTPPFAKKGWFFKMDMGIDAARLVKYSS